MNLKTLMMIMLTLTLLTISFSCVSAVDIDDTNATAVIQDDNSQLEIQENNNLYLENENSFDEKIAVSDDSKLGAITPTVTLTDSSHTAATNNVAKGTTVTINVKAEADFKNHYDTKTVNIYSNNAQVTSVNLQNYDPNYNGQYNDYRGSFTYTFSNEGTYVIKGIMPAYAGYETYNQATSNSITYVVGNGGNTGNDPIIDDLTPTSNSTATLRIYDSGYPSNSTIYSDGDYRAVLMYDLSKSGDGFSDEAFTVTITDANGGSQSYDMALNSQNTLGTLTITEDNVYSFVVNYTATLNGKEYSVLSNVLTYVTGNTSNVSGPSGNGSDPVSGASATLRIYDSGYPSNSTIYSDGDYRAVLMYDLSKSGDGFSDEAFTVTITDANGGSQSYDMALNSQNTLGTLTITEDNVYSFVVTYTATLNGAEYSVRSNVLTYVTGNTSNVSGPSGNGSDPVSGASATLRIYDSGYPSNSTIYSDGDYRAVLMYDLSKSGDGFSDEDFTVTITDTDGKSQSYDMALNSQNTLGTLTITEDNVYSFVVTYTATLNGKEYSTRSNVLTYITKNTSNTTEPDNDDTNQSTGGNDSGSGNGTVPTVDPSKLQILIRDANYPNYSTINVEANYTPVLEYYVTVPTGDLLTSEIIIFCDGEGILTIDKENVVNSKYTKIATGKILNETGSHVFTAQYKYYVFMGSGDDISSNAITYVISNSSSTNPAANQTVPGKNETDNPSDDKNDTGNNTNPETNQTGDNNGTSDNNETEDVSLVIRDVSSPKNYVISIDEEFTPVIEYLVVKPSGEFLSDEIVITCNGEGIQTIQTPVDKTYTKVTLNKKLNETGTYVFKAQYKYYVFMGLASDVDSNTITYNVVISNTTTPVTNDTKPSDNPSGDNNGTDDTKPSDNPSDDNNGTDDTKPSVNPSDDKKNETGNATNPVNDQTKDDSSISNESGKIASKISVIRLDSDLKITGVLSDFNGKPISGESISYTIGNEQLSTETKDNGEFIIPLKENRNVLIKFDGNNNYSASNLTFVFENDVGETDIKLASKFNVTEAQSIETYAVDFPAGERGTTFQFKLTDSNGKPIANAPVQFAYKTVILNRSTDENGIVFLGVSTQFADSYLCALSYLGDETHNATFVAFNFKLNKKPITITAKAKTFKSSVKTKKFTVTLKTEKCASKDGKVYLKSGKKVTLKVNGKTYTAKINAKGQATFKITKLTKKGKFNAVIKFAGDKTYNAATKKVKITIK